MRGILEELRAVTHLFLWVMTFWGGCVTSWVQCLHHTLGGGDGPSLGLGSLHILSAKSKPWAKERGQGAVGSTGDPEGICPRMLQKLPR